MRHWSCAFLCLLIASTIAAAPPESHHASTDKQLIIDGSIVHDVGRLHLNITNFGLIGSHYTLGAPYSWAPSGRWPGAGGVNHLYGAGLWVGGVRLGQRLVSTGQYAFEIQASPEPEDVIYETAWDAAQAVRYPFGDPDDDGDGFEDEDPPNGFDDDDDGDVDEDGAGIGSQQFRAEMTDTYSTDIFPDHEPLQLAIVQNSMQWMADDVADFVGFEYVIRNSGEETIAEVYVAMFSDFDIDDPQGSGGEAADDMVGFASQAVEAYPGQWVDVEVAYAYEGIGATASGYMGWLPVGEPGQIGVRAFQHYSGQAPFDQGGDPTNDFERYESMSEDNVDGDSVAPADYRNLISVGPFAELAPGEEMSVSFVLVAGADLDDMLRNAGRAQLVYEGLAFDRDGDPGNGDEFVVRWLGPEEIAVPILDPGEEAGDTPPADGIIRLTAAPNPFNPTLEVKAALPRDGWVRASVVDPRGREVRVLHDGMASAGSNSWLWNGRDGSGRTLASGVYLVRLETAERVMQRAVTLVK